MYSDIGLPALQPKLLQATLLAVVVPKVAEDKQLWFQSNHALQSCVGWYLETTQWCMHHPKSADHLDIISSKYVAAYLQLIRERHCSCLYVLAVAALLVLCTAG